MSAATSDPLRARLAAIEARIRAGELKQADAALDEMRAIAPGDVRVCLAEASLARAQHDPHREIAALERAVSLTPRWPAAHVELARALARHDRHEAALAAVEKAVEFAPADMGVLELAVAIANQAGVHARAESHLRAALALRPGNVSIERALADCLYTMRRYAEAEAVYRRLLALSPDGRGLWVQLGQCLIGLDRKHEAAEVLAQASTLAPDDPMIRFHLSRARGETPASMPNRIVQALFDDYSGRFDRHLAGGLKYRVPRRVAEIVRARHPERNVDVLDLGCGTGLTGVYLGGVGGALVGVDLSAGMIERARRHGIYTRLHHGDLRDELGGSAAASYDYVIANDVFIYVGDLTAVIPAAYRVLRSAGALIFSCELASADEGDLSLRESMRYAHAQHYVERLCRAAGFAGIGIEHLELRAEGLVPMPGFIVVAERA